MKIRGNDTAPSIWREDEKEVIRWKSYFSSIWREDEEKEAARTAGNILQQCVRTTHSSYTSEVLQLFNDTVRRRHDRADHEEGTHFPASGAGASGQPLGMSHECSEVKDEVASEKQGNSEGHEAREDEEETNTHRDFERWEPPSAQTAVLDYFASDKMRDHAVPESVETHMQQQQHTLTYAAAPRAAVPHPKRAESWLQAAAASAAAEETESLEHCCVCCSEKLGSGSVSFDCGHTYCSRPSCASRSVHKCLECGKPGSAFQKQILAEKAKETKKASIRSTIKTFNSIHRAPGYIPIELLLNPREAQISGKQRFERSITHTHLNLYSPSRGQVSTGTEGQGKGAVMDHISYPFCPVYVWKKRASTEV